MSYVVEEPTETKSVVVNNSEAPERSSSRGVVTAVLIIAALVILAFILFGTGLLRSLMPMY